MHGGIGMTDEYDIGLYMKRDRVLNELFGDAGLPRRQAGADEGLLTPRRALRGEEKPLAEPRADQPNRAYAMGLARAFAGAIIFGLPLLMTMEMWFLGISLHPGRLSVFLGVNFLMLVGLSRFGGFERTDRLAEDVMDALAACGVGIIGSAAVLWLLAIIGGAMPIDEIAGKIAIQSVPMSFGAMIARKQLSGGGASRRTRKRRCAAPAMAASSS